MTRDHHTHHHRPETTDRTTATTDRTTTEGRSHHLTYQVKVSISNFQLQNPFPLSNFVFGGLIWIFCCLLCFNLFLNVCCCSMLFLSFLILLLCCLFIFYSRVVSIVVKLCGLVSFCLLLVRSWFLNSISIVVSIGKFCFDCYCYCQCILKGKLMQMSIQRLLSMSSRHSKRIMHHFKVLGILNYVV
jgi:hypothetical protein